jgi:hypothetical protein
MLLLVPSSRQRTGDHHAPVPYESHPRRRTTGRRAGPPVPGGAAGPRAAGPARGLRRSGQAPDPPAVPPDNRLVQQAHAPGGHMPAGSTRLSSRHGMKSWRTDDESSRGTDLTATRTELNNMSASGAAPFRKHGRKYSALGAPDTNARAESPIAAINDHIQGSAYLCRHATPSIRQIRALPPAR